LNRTAGAIILRISHGYEVQERDDPFVKLADIATEQFSLSTSPGGFLVNLVPSRKVMSCSMDFVPYIVFCCIQVSFIPDWFPGTGFKKTAREWANTLNEMIERPHQYVKDQMVSLVVQMLR
jgi:hypothetical protein